MIEKEMFRQLKRSWSTANLQRIENVIGVGIPDMYFSTTYSNGWIELKECKLRKNNKVYIPYRAGQKAWRKRFYGKFCKIYLICTVKGARNSWSLFNYYPDNLTLEEYKIKSLIYGSIKEVTEFMKITL